MVWTPNKMPEERWAKQLFQWVSFERINRGRPRKSRKKEMQEAVQDLNRAWNNRKESKKGAKTTLIQTQKRKSKKEMKELGGQVTIL